MDDPDFELIFPWQEPHLPQHQPAYPFYPSPDQINRTETEIYHLAQPSQQDLPSLQYQHPKVEQVAENKTSIAVTKLFKEPLQLEKYHVVLKEGSKQITPATEIYGDYVQWIFGKASLSLKQVQQLKALQDAYNRCKLETSSHPLPAVTFWVSKEKAQTQAKKKGKLNIWTDDMEEVRYGFVQNKRVCFVQANDDCLRHDVGNSGDRMRGAKRLFKKLVKLLSTAPDKAPSSVASIAASSSCASSVAGSEYASAIVKAAPLTHVTSPSHAFCTSTIINSEPASVAIGGKVAGMPVAWVPPHTVRLPPQSSPASSLSCSESTPTITTGLPNCVISRQNAMPPPPSISVSTNQELFHLNTLANLEQQVRAICIQWTDKTKGLERTSKQGLVANFKEDINHFQSRGLIAAIGDEMIDIVNTFGNNMILYDNGVPLKLPDGPKTSKLFHLDGTNNLKSRAIDYCMRLVEGSTGRNRTMKMGLVEAFREDIDHFHSKGLLVVDNSILVDIINIFGIRMVEFWQKLPGPQHPGLPSASAGDGAGGVGGGNGSGGGPMGTPHVAPVGGTSVDDDCGGGGSTGGVGTGEASKCCDDAAPPPRYDQGTLVPGVIDTLPIDAGNNELFIARDSHLQPTVHDEYGATTTGMFSTQHLSSSAGKCPAFDIISPAVFAQYDSVDSQLSRVASVKKVLASKDSVLRRTDSLALAFNSVSSVDSKVPGIYQSNEWMSDYSGEHKNMSYTQDVFRAAEDEASANVSSKWMDMYQAVLENPLESMPALKLPPVETEANTEVETDSKAEPPKKKAPASRQVTPKLKVYVKPTPLDILCGRGGKSNNWKGNERYRAIVEETKSIYNRGTKYQKTLLSQQVVDKCTGEGSRFLKFDDKAKEWYPIPNILARRKAGQALREENTPEARAAKRAKYNPEYKKSLASEALKAKCLSQRESESGAIAACTRTPLFCGSSFTYNKEISFCGDDDSGEEK